MFVAMMMNDFNYRNIERLPMLCNMIRRLILQPEAFFVILFYGFGVRSDKVTLYDIDPPNRSPVVPELGA